MADNEVEQIIEERYAVNPNILSNWGDSNDDSRETQFLEQAEEMEENMKNKESNLGFSSHLAHQSPLLTTGIDAKCRYLSDFLFFYFP